jgi:hypothetical protein
MCQASARLKGAVLGSVGEKPDRRPVAFPILAQLHKQLLRQDGIDVSPIQEAASVGGLSYSKQPQRTRGDLENVF